jgi:hypothetical protein
MLNNKQKKAIELLVYSPHMTYNMMASECGVSRDTLHRWRYETPEFMEELDKATKNRWKSAEQLAINTMINLMSEGNYSATKYVLDSLDYAPKQKIEADVKATTISVSIEED